MPDKEGLSELSKHGSSEKKKEIIIRTMFKTSVYWLSRKCPVLDFCCLMNLLYEFIFAGAVSNLLTFKVLFAAHFTLHWNILRACSPKTWRNNSVIWGVLWPWLLWETARPPEMIFWELKKETERNYFQIFTMQPCFILEHFPRGFQGF